MAKQLTIDKAGRVVIPKRLRDKLHLLAGDAIELEGTEEQIVLRPAREKPEFVKEDGMWIFRTGKRLTVEETNKILRTIRDERDAQNLGWL